MTPPPRSRPWSATTLAGAFVLSTTAFLLLHCWLTSRVKPLWMDEVLSWTLVADPSFPHALDALAHGADGGFPSYYFVAWPVAHLFGTGELCVRLVSTAFMAAAFGLLFGLLRRTYGLLPAMLTVALSIGGSTLILYQNSELRFYADLFFSATVATCGFDALFRRAGDARWPWGAMALNATGHALLVLCHPFGLVYSATICCAALAAFFLRRPGNFLTPYLTSTAAGSACFLLWVRGFLQQTHIVAGRGHLPVPSVADFFRIYAQLAPSLYYDDRTKGWAASHLLPVRQHLPALGVVGVVMLLLIVLAGLFVRSLFAGGSASPGAAPERETRPTDAHLLLLAAAFILLPAGIWVISHLGKSLFIHRYLIPSVLGFAIVYAHFFARVGRRIAARGTWTTPRGKAVCVAGAFGFVLIYVAWPLVAAFTTPDGHAIVRERIAQESRGVPVVCGAQTFWQSGHYAPVSPYWFILDRGVAADPRNGIAAVSEFNFTTVVGEYYPALHVLPSAEFLGQNPEFIVESAGGNLWYDKYLRGNPAYAVREMPGLPPNTVWVTRLPR